MRRMLILGLLALLAVLGAVPALAADDEGDTPAEDETVSEEEPEPELISQEVGEPAIVVVPAEAEEDVPAWTYRFLIPTLMAATVLIVAGTVVAYFNRVVKARYEPVE